MAQRKDLFIDAGANYEARFSVLTIIGTDADLSAYTAKAMMRRHFQSANAVTFGSEITGDEVIITLTAAESAAIVPGHYVYDVDLLDATTGTVIRLVQGVVRVSPSVTR